MRKLKIPKVGFNLKTFKFSKLSKPGRLLVFESTGTSLHGAVASCTAMSAFSLGPTALSSSTDMAAAVGEVLEQLKRQSKKRLPTTAVLLTPCAAGALLNLPIDPRKPRPAAQMAEMVRWELEELLVQQSELWTLGALLMGRGEISAEQRRELETGAQAEGQRPSAALYQRIVASDRLNECLALQEQLAGGDEELASGWAGQVTVENEEEGFSWLVTGVGSGLRDGWVRAFKKHGVFLARIYPRLGACLPLIEPTADWLLLDVTQEQLGLFRGQGRRIDTVLYKPCPFGRAVPTEVVEIVGDLLRAETRCIYLTASADQWSDLTAALDSSFDRRGIRVMAPGGGEPPNSEGGRIAALEGVARNALGAEKRALPLAPIAAQQAPPPLWKRKELWPWVGIGLVVVGLAAYDTSMRIQTAGNKAELTRLDLEYERKMQVKKQAEALAAEAKTLQAELAVKEQELKEQERLLNILDNIIRYRQELIPGLLQALRDAAGELVMLDLFEESADRNRVLLAGWALTDTEGQQFANALNEQVAPWHYRVEDVKLTRGKGRLGIDGYLLNILLVHAPAGTDKKMAPPPAAGKDAPAAPAKPSKKNAAKGTGSHG